MAVGDVAPIRVGLVGYGGIGKVHALAYRSIPYHYGLPADAVRIVAVATSSAASAGRAAREIGCPVWSDDYRRIVERDDVDLVDCSVPNDLHEPVVVAAAAAGKHIYCEKPLARTVAEGARMADAVGRAGVKAQPTFNFRFFPAITRAKQLVDDGFLGRVFSFRGRYYRSSYIDAAKPMSWRLDKEASGGGAMHDLGSHVLDLGRLPARPVRVGQRHLGDADRPPPGQRRQRRAGSGGGGRLLLPAPAHGRRRARAWSR